jgi:thiamine biosynthesis protein ThiI
MDTLFLLKYAEIALKGGRRASFEEELRRDLERRLRGIDHRIRRRWGRFYVLCGEGDAAAVAGILSRTFGIVSFARAYRTPRDMGAVEEAAAALGRRFLEEGKGSRFKVETRRTDKSFPLTSYQISSRLGELLLDRVPGLRVDVHRPEWVLKVEVRDAVYLYGPETGAPGGLPLGSGGKGLLLLSGGIDSPVAGWLLGKRGLRVDGIHFHTPPFTSERALEKAREVAGILAGHLTGFTLFTVPLTEAQVHIRKRAPGEESTLLLRACMMKIAGTVALEGGYNSLITGESLGQVASQTAESLRFTESFSDLPVFRPLLGYNKEEIVAQARRIGTYRTSILPYEDCCTLFVPRHPVIRPDFSRMRASFDSLRIESILQEAVEGMCAEDL